MIYNDNKNSECLLIHIGVPNISMGFASIYKFLKKNFVPTTLIQISINSKENIFEKIKEYQNIKLIGFSIHWLPQLAISLKMAELMKTFDNFKNTKIVAGGITASCYPDKILKYSFMDYVIKGDGEIPLLKLFNLIIRINNESIETVPNLIYLINKKIITNTAQYFTSPDMINELEKEVIMDKDLFKTIKYALSIGRGCNENCIYCGGGKKAFHKWSGRDQILVRKKTDIQESIRAIINNSNEYLYLLNDQDGKCNMISESLADYDLNPIKEIKIDCWGLPDLNNIHKIYNNTIDTKYKLWIEISPETGNESNRKKIKSFSFTNNELESFIDNFFNKFPNQKIMIFFSYYLPFTDREDTDTRKYIIYLTKKYRSFIHLKKLMINHWPLSTDPESALQKNEIPGILSNIKSFDDYINKLVSTKTTIGNLLAHFPQIIKQEEFDYYCNFFRFENILRLIDPYLYINFISLFKNFNEYNKFLNKCFIQLFNIYIKPSLQSMTFSHVFTEFKSNIFGFSFERDEVKTKSRLDIIWLRMLLIELKNKKNKMKFQHEDLKECFYMDNTNKMITQEDLFNYLEEQIIFFINNITGTYFLTLNDKPSYDYIFKYNFKKINTIQDDTGSLMKLIPVLNPLSEFQEIKYSYYQVKSINNNQNLLMLGKKCFSEWIEWLDQNTLANVDKKIKNYLFINDDDKKIKENLYGNIDKYWQIINEKEDDPINMYLSDLIADVSILNNKFFSGSGKLKIYINDYLINKPDLLFQDKIIFNKADFALDVYFINFYLNYHLNKLIQPLIIKPCLDMIILNSIYFPSNDIKPFMLYHLISNVEYKFLLLCNGINSFENIFKILIDNKIDLTINFLKKLAINFYLNHIIF